MNENEGRMSRPGFASTQFSVSDLYLDLDPDLEIRGRRSSRPLDRQGGGGGGLQNKFFWPFGPPFGLKIRGAGLPGPSPGSATV